MTTEKTTQDTEKEPLAWTVDFTASRLGVSRNSLYAAIKRGEIPTMQLGRRVLVPVAALLIKLAAVGQGGAK